MGASERWFRRRRGGAEERQLKDQGWRSKGEPLARPPGRPANPPAVRVSRVAVTTRQGQDHDVSGPTPAVVQPAPDSLSHTKPPHEREVEATLMVPFTPGSGLKKSIQRAEDDYCAATGSKRIRVIERGGSRLLDLLGRNDPWASQRTCGDEACVTCTSRTWIRERTKEAKKRGEELPAAMLKSGSHQCRREGLNYSLQCLTCLKEGCRTLYRGEASRSGRQRHGEHWRDLQDGVVTSPMVIHSIQEHGGIMPSLLAVIDRIEPSPLYRAARESVAISRLGMGPSNLNRCQEWGAPRVPVITLRGGGDDGSRELKEGELNERKEWTAETLGRMETGDSEEGQTGPGGGQPLGST